MELRSFYFSFVIPVECGNGRLEHKMEQRIIATSEPGFMGYKKPALWIVQGNTMTKLATFIDDKARKDFIEVLEEEFQGHEVKDV